MMIKRLKVKLELPIHNTLIKTKHFFLRSTTIKTKLV